jgi:two-component system response regulator
MNSENLKQIEILLVEDNPGDVRLAQEAFSEAKIPNHINVVNDGVEALAFLHRKGEFANMPHVELIVLDINLPRKNGHEVLTEIKADKNLRSIPVVILTTSKSESDILQSYDLQASCFVTKPLDFDEFMNVMHTIEDFWLSTVKLPHKGG